MASSSHLKPGEEGKIIAKLNTGGRTGLITKTVRVYSNDPQRPVVTFVLKVRVE